MKKVFSTLLLAVFLFHSVGYYFILLGVCYTQNVSINNRLDAGNYTDTETTTLKIPLVVPYYTESKDYERVNGSFEHDGEFYKLIKQRLDRDTLYVVCMKDDRAKTLATAITDFVKLSNDLTNSSRQALKVVISFTKDYTPAPNLQVSDSQGWSQMFSFPRPAFNLLTSISQVASPPPDRIC